ncbi:flagellar filament capping protein FliD [Paenibacillus arenilitoris]|uniref:Flagellar hook-associated protein 2 n=1 Tax=Paenibacillus arenilitoris TaxID=2772299 RepID=A0A927CKH8_9BACL|nr:flagellar filament capping protein FliD [Paenibacillus arenilitoris]MBD2868417.1 flagellar filament capping protein FliD [Paenibacillus arenilitoris]
MRISGLASGLDTDTIIKDLMNAQRIPLDKMTQKKQLLEWKRDDYRTLNNKILEFRNAAFDMKLQSGYLAKKVSSSQENIVSVSGTPNASEGQYSIRVDQLAATAGFNTGNLSGDAGGSKTLDLKLGLTGNSTLTLTGDKGSANIAIKTTDTIDQLVKAVNDQSNVTGIKATYDSTMDRLFFVSAKTGQASKIDMKIVNDGTATNMDLNAALNMSSRTITGGAIATPISADNQTFTMKVDGTDYNFSVTNATTIEELVDQMNESLTDTGITASLSNGQLVLENSLLKPVAFSDSNSGAVVTNLGLQSALTASTQINVTGTNAKVLFNGIASEYESNNFSIAGMTFDAKQVSADTVTVGVLQDVDAVVENIKKFVEKYNSLIDEINKETLEKRNRDFQPLTQAQKDEMEEDDIKRWEEKAKSGMLANDQLLSSGVYSLRRILSDTVNGLPVGQLKSLAEIGISNANVSGSTVSGAYSDRGKLYIDETKLKKAITENPDEVMTLFTTDGSTESTDGIATRLYDKAAALFNQITDRAGTATSIESNYELGKESQRISKQMAALTDRLTDLETRYYKQFTAMETFINQMNSQSSWLAQQFSS